MEERSFGIIPMRVKNHQLELLMIRHRAGHWGFPKGHQEKDESIEETAARELQEETGLNVIKNYSDAIFSEMYFYSREDQVRSKTVLYFLALVEGTVSIQESELSEAIWINFHQAKNYATFRETKKICTKVEEYLLNNHQKIAGSM